MHESAYNDAAEFVSRFLTPGQPTRIADVGSFDVNGCLRPLFADPAWTYTGLDITSGPNVDIVLPSEYGWSDSLAEQFDIVISTQVCEHVREPWRWIVDVALLARPCGLIYVCTPHTWEYHEYPIDCWRVWPDGMRALFDHAGLTVIECRKNATDTTGIAQAP